MNLSELNTEFVITHHNEADKLPSLTLNEAQKGAVRLRAVATIDGQDASDKTWDEFEQAIEQGRDVVFKYTQISPDAE